jgi:hypothetical protein
MSKIWMYSVRKLRYKFTVLKAILMFASLIKPWYLESTSINCLTCTSLGYEATRSVYAQKAVPTQKPIKTPIKPNENIKKDLNGAGTAVVIAKAPIMLGSANLGVVVENLLQFLCLCLL